MWLAVTLKPFVIDGNNVIKKRKNLLSATYKWALKAGVSAHTLT